MYLEYRKIEEADVIKRFENEEQRFAVEKANAIRPFNTKAYKNGNGEQFFRFAGCNRVVQDQGDRPVYHIDMNGGTKP